MTPLARAATMLVRGHWRGLALSVVLQFATCAFGIGLMATSAWLISMAGLHPSIAALSVAIVGVRFFGLARGIVRYCERVVSHDVTLRGLASLRVSAFRRLEPLAPARLADYRTGDVVARLVDDVETLDHLFIRVVGPSLTAVLVAALVALVIGRHHGRLALILVGGIVLAGMAAPAVAARLGSRAAARVVLARAALSAAWCDLVEGLPDLLVFGGVAAHAAHLGQAGAGAARAQARHGALVAAGSWSGSMIGELTALAALAAAVPLVRGGGLSGVGLAVVALTALATFEVVGPLAGAYQHLGAIRAAAGRVFAPDALARAARANPISTAEPRGARYEACGLSFAYPGAAVPALERVSLVLTPGRSVAVVGPSGSGKSTLAHLLVRFWDAEPGMLALDGADAVSLEPGAVRRCVAFAEQRTRILTGTVRENLRLASPDAGDDLLWKVLETTGMAASVAAMPDGLDTWLGEHGHRLSGGERQRLALARVFLRPAPIVVLDEPTANVDPLTERQLMETIVGLARDRAVLMMTHRLGALTDVSEIVVLLHGRVVQRGPFAELAGEDGWFRSALELERTFI